MSKLTRVVILAAAAAGVLAWSVPASAEGVGSDNTMFKRHFWRGQAYHGEGYHPQVSDIGRDRVKTRAYRGPQSFEALVE